MSGKPDAQVGTIRCPRCGNDSNDGTIYLIVPVVEAAPVIGIADSIVLVDGPMTRRRVPDGARLECGRMNDDGAFCGHRFLPTGGIDALLWSTDHG